MTMSLILTSWREILLPAAPWGEKILRPLIVYGALLVAFRLIARRGRAQATLFDFLIMLLISNVVQNAMIGEDNSVLGALAGAAVLLVLSSSLDAIAGRSAHLRHVLEGRAVVLVENGRVREHVLRRLAVDLHDLHAAIRKSGLARMEDVDFAILELDGAISIIKHDDDTRPYDCLPGDLDQPAGKPLAEPA